MSLLLGLLLFVSAGRAEEFRMVARPAPKIVPGPAWKGSIDLDAERKKPLFLYFTAAW
ncbi:MAG: hypothetical protein AAGD14_02015 [Planctomycetota bacterium]